MVVVLFEDEVLGGLLWGETRAAAVDDAVIGAGDLLVLFELPYFLFWVVRRLVAHFFLFWKLNILCINGKNLVTLFIQYCFNIFFIWFFILELPYFFRYVWTDFYDFLQSIKSLL